MTQKQFICISCPMGCPLTVETEGDTVLSVQGNGCKRGEIYGRQEAVAPMRTLTASVRVENRKTPVSVKTSTPIPKEKMQECMQTILSQNFHAPISQGDILIQDILHLGADIIATRTVE